jgi:hypothetical protein
VFTIGGAPRPYREDEVNRLAMNLRLRPKSIKNAGDDRGGVGPAYRYNDGYDTYRGRHSDITCQQ